MIDRDRLGRLFGSADLAPLLERMRQRLERGIPLSGTIVLTNLGARQRAAIGALLGRPPAQTGENYVSVSLDDLAANLAAAGVCDSLRRAVIELTGPVDDVPARRAATEERWAAVFAQAPAVLQAPPFAAVVARWRESGSLKRVAGNSPEIASGLLERAARAATAFPLPGPSLAQAGARLLGHAHALDADEPLANLVLQLAAAHAGLSPPSNTEERRLTWAAVGILCDELSAPALALNLPAAGDGYTARLLRRAADAGEPVHVSLRSLVRHPLGADAGLGGRTIFVCENATIVALAAAQLGSRSASLVSLQGQYATPTRVLLRQLLAAGARFRYHGDFDAGGLAIARRFFGEFPAGPWRFGVGDYQAAPKSAGLAGALGATPWEPELATVMAADGRLVHEEAVAETLLADLAGAARP